MRVEPLDQRRNVTLRSPTPENHQSLPSFNPRPFAVGHLRFATVVFIRGSSSLPFFLFTSTIKLPTAMRVTAAPISSKLARARPAFINHQSSIYPTQQSLPSARLRALCDFAVNTSSIRQEIRTGSASNLRLVKSGFHWMFSESSARPGRRASKEGNARAASSRASGAPRQLWGPWPKLRCLLGVRRISKVSGHGNTSGSRLAAAFRAETRFAVDCVPDIARWNIIPWDRDAGLQRPLPGIHEKDIGLHHLGGPRHPAPFQSRPV